MSIRESTIERTVCQWAIASGILTMKLASPNQKGQPDRMFLHKGKVCFIEFKAVGKKPTALQEKWMGDLLGRGFEVNWFDSAPKAIAWLKEMFTLD